MRAARGPVGVARAEKATHVSMFVGALVLHAVASAVLVWTFAGAVESWLVMGCVGYVVGVPWLLWLFRLPWAARDLLRALSPSTPAPAAEEVEDRPSEDALESTDAVGAYPEPTRAAA